MAGTLPSFDAVLEQDEIEEDSLGEIGAGLGGRPRFAQQLSGTATRPRRQGGSDRRSPPPAGSGRRPSPRTPHEQSQSLSATGSRRPVYRYSATAQKNPLTTASMAARRESVGPSSAPTTSATAQFKTAVGKGLSGAVESPSHVIKLHRTGSFEVERVMQSLAVAQEGKPAEFSESLYGPDTRRGAPQPRNLFSSNPSQLRSEGRRVEHHELAEPTGGDYSARGVHAFSNSKPIHQSAPPVARRRDPFDLLEGDRGGSSAVTWDLEDFKGVERIISQASTILERREQLEMNENGALESLRRARAALDYGGGTRNSSGAAGQLLSACQRFSSACLAAAEYMSLIEEIRCREYQQQLVAMQQASQINTRELMKSEREEHARRCESLDAQHARERERLLSESEKLRQYLKEKEAECDELRRREKQAILDGEERVQSSLEAQGRELRAAAELDVEKMRAAVNQLREAAEAERFQVEQEIKESCNAQIRLWRNRIRTAEERAIAAEAAGAEAEASAVRKGTEEREKLRMELTSELAAARKAAMEAEATTSAKIAAMEEEMRQRGRKELRAAEEKIEELLRQRQRDLRDAQLLVEERVAQERVRASAESAAALRQIRATHSAALTKAGKEVMDLKKKLLRLSARIPPFELLDEGGPDD